MLLDVLKSPGKLTALLILVLIFTFIYRSRKVQYTARQVLLTLACGLILFFISLNIRFPAAHGTLISEEVGWPIQLYTQPTGSLDGQAIDQGQPPLLRDDFSTRIMATLIFYLSFAAAASTFVVKRSRGTELS